MGCFVEIMLNLQDGDEPETSYSKEMSDLLLNEK
jgi:hypothetical protein